MVLFPTAAVEQRGRVAVVNPSYQHTDISSWLQGLVGQQSQWQNCLTLLPGSSQCFIDKFKPPDSNTVVYNSNQTWWNNQRQSSMLVLNTVLWHLDTQGLRSPEVLLAQHQVNTVTARLSHQWKSMLAGRVFVWALISQQQLRQLQVKPPPCRGEARHALVVRDRGQSLCPTWLNYLTTNVNKSQDADVRQMTDILFCLWQTLGYLKTLQGTWA